MQYNADLVYSVLEYETEFYMWQIHTSILLRRGIDLTLKELDTALGTLIAQNIVEQTTPLGSKGLFGYRKLRPTEIVQAKVDRAKHKSSH